VRCLMVRSFSVTAPPEFYPLSLHDALPIWHPRLARECGLGDAEPAEVAQQPFGVRSAGGNLENGLRHESGRVQLPVAAALRLARSEEHTSELQSRENLVCRLLLEKKQ